MVARAGERDAGVDQPPQRIGEIGAGRVKHRQMVEAGCAGWRRSAAAAFPSVETDMVMITARRHEGCVPAIGLHQLEAEHAAIEAERPVEIGDLEVNMPDPGAGCDRARCPVFDHEASLPVQVLPVFIGNRQP